VLVQATGGTRFMLGLVNNMKLDMATGRILTEVDGVYHVTLSVSVKREEDATGQREVITGLGVNGEAPTLFTQPASTQQGNRWVDISSTTLIRLKASETLSLWLTQINDGGGTGADEMEISNVHMVVNRIH